MGRYKPSSFSTKELHTYGNNFCISLYLVKLATVAFEDLHRQLEVEQKKQTCCQIECNNNNICTKQIIKLPQKFKKFDLNETQDESQRLLQMANFLNFVMFSLKIVIFNKKKMVAVALWRRGLSFPEIRGSNPDMCNFNRRMHPFGRIWIYVLIFRVHYPKRVLYVPSSKSRHTYYANKKSKII